MKKIDIRHKLCRHPTKAWKKRPKITHIVVHTTASDNQDPFKTNAYHIGPNHISSTGCPKITYHDFITKEGVVYHCNDYEERVWHAGTMNKVSIGVVMAFRGQIDTNSPEPIQFDALLKHLTILCLYLKILPRNVIGHREVPGMYTLLGKGSVKYKKTCPGMSIDLDQLRKLVTLSLQRRLATERLYQGKIDGIFGPMSQAALTAFNPLR